MTNKAKKSVSTFKERLNAHREQQKLKQLKTIKAAKDSETTKYNGII